MLQDSTLVELRILGSVHLKASDGRDVEALVRQEKRTALLVYLAAALPRGPHRRDTLLALFWPESDASHARAALNQALYVLRTALGEQAIVPRGDGAAGLNGDVVWCDVVAFEAALDAGRPHEALALYRGDLLEGFFVTGAPEFERWVERERARLRERAAEGAWALAETRAAAGDPLEAERWARRAADLQPADEVGARRLMTFLNDLGDRAAAIQAYETYASRLAKEYDLEPSAETQALAATIREAEAPVAAVRSTPPIAAEPRRHLPRRRLATAALTLAIVAGLGYAVTMWKRGQAARAPRVLVLPFQNLGPAGDAYFADGITDEITARLATVKGLSVVGGQAAMRYKGTAKTPRQMAEETGVDYVLEGTVSWQRTGRGRGRVRVRPQLVSTRDEAQVWAAVLDEDMTDLFSLLSGVAERVVGELHVALEPPQQRNLAAVPTRDLQAYDYYLRGRAFGRGTWSMGNNLAAIRLFEQAIERDSTFALAQARLSFSHTEAFWLNQLGPEHLVQAKAAGERALRLDPALPDAHLAMGHYYYACCGDYEQALEHLTTSDAMRPGDAQVVMLIGNVYKRRGDWEQAIRYYERAANLDSRWHVPLLNLAEVQLWLRHYEEAERTSRRALSVEPRETFAYTILASVPLLRDGDIPAARRIVREASLSDAFTGMRLPFYLELLDRDYRAALARARGSEPAGWFWEDWLVSDHIRRAVALRLSDDSATARVEFDSARVELERDLPGAKQRPQAYNSLSSALAIAYAGLGSRSDAVGLAGRVLGSDPVAFDALDGPAVLENLALAYLFAGDKSTALDLLERVMSVPSLPSSHVLRLDPLWDPLRGDPRFERLAR